MATATAPVKPAAQERAYLRYLAPTAWDVQYIAKAQERARTEALGIIKARDTKTGKGVALVSSASEPNKLHIVRAWRVAGTRLYICDCKGMDPHGDHTYMGYPTCKHAEKVRQLYGD